LGRTVVAAAVLGVWLRGQGRPTLRASWALAISGGILALHWVTFFQSIALSSVAIALLGYASFPMFVLLLERWLHGRYWQRVDLAVVGLVVAGLVLTVPEFRWDSAAVRGLAWGIVSGFMFAWLVVRTRAFASHRDASSLAFWLNVFATMVLVPVVVTQGGTGGPIDGSTLLLVVVLGVVCTALAHTLFIMGIAGTSAITAAIVAALEPVYGIALAWAWLGEVPTLRIGAGAALLVTAAILASRRGSTSTVS
ncbi:MAG: DMT family transporter, partial [Casimicrobiaceae bacterium]